MPNEIKPTKEYIMKGHRTRRQKEYLLEQARLMKASGHSGKAIAETLGVHPATISKWLNARIQKAGKQKRKYTKKQTTMTFWQRLKMLFGITP